MHTADTRPLDLRRLAAGSELHLSVHQGCELFCRQGQVEILAPQQAWADGTPWPAIRLSPGQGWRADADLQIRVRSLSRAMASLELQPGPAAKSRIASEEGMRLRGWTLAGFRRGRRAA
jgi:hypothetical protein